jgi:hypothetical protein
MGARPEEERGWDVERSGNLILVFEAWENMSRCEVGVVKSRLILM